MPNNVHVLVDVWQTPLGKMVLSWKRFIATRAEALLLERRSPTRRSSVTAQEAPARRAALQWQREYWDTFMRDEEQERKAVRYIESNPVKTKLCQLPQDWPFSSARFRDRYGRLMLPGEGSSNE
jgi:REP element-mobilizing transposase RayT